ncbi:MAG TPA: choice-of-anchor Q domain-containing protein [Rudaea sp.]
MPSNSGRFGSANPDISNTTFFANTAFKGGAVYNLQPGAYRINNATFSYNNAHYGGAIYNFRTGLLLGVRPRVSNTILWANLATIRGNGIENEAAVVDVYHSVMEGTCPPGATCTNVVDTSPLLSGLSDHGGFTKTMMPSAGGSAVDAGDDATCSVIDQRGIGRPEGSHCDIGAVERSAFDDTIFKDDFEPY